MLPKEETKMKFFIPDKSPEDAENLYLGFRQSVAGTGEARIYSLTFRERVKGKWKEVKARVGNPDPLEGRMVMAIVDTDRRYYVIWAKGRGENHMMIDFYGRELSAREIVREGKVVVPVSGHEFIALLNKTSPKNESDPVSLKE